MEQRPLWREKQETRQEGEEGANHGGPGFYRCRPPGSETPGSGSMKPRGIRRSAQQCAGWVGGGVSKKI